MRLARLTGLERERLLEEYQELEKTIAYLQSLLSDEALLMGVIKQEMGDIRDKFADERRTDKTQRLHMPPDQIRRYVERKAIHAEIHKQKNVPVDHTNHTITSRCYCTPHEGKTLSPSARLFCKKSI